MLILELAYIIPLAMNALWWSLTLCIVLLPLPALLLPWQQLSVCLLDEVHAAQESLCVCVIHQSRSC